MAWKNRKRATTMAMVKYVIVESGSKKLVEKHMKIKKGGKKHIQTCNILIL